MPSYYLNACLSTIFSIVTTGRLPAQLASWAKFDRLFCVKNIAHSFSKKITALNQVFILELTLIDRNENSDDHLTLDQLDPETIKQIIVYSSTGSKLLAKLFNGNCPKPILINPGVYPILANPKQSFSDFFKTDLKIGLLPSIKKARTISTYPLTSSFNNNIEQKEAIIKDNIYWLSSYNEHIQLLTTVFSKAKQTILLSTFGINHETLNAADLYKLIPKAIARGVKIYIYFNIAQIIADNILEFLRTNQVFYSNISIDSKMIACDEDFIAAGTFNWLSANKPDYTPSADGSLCIQSVSICSKLIRGFCKYFEYYSHEQLGNTKRANYSEEVDNTIPALVGNFDSKKKIIYASSLTGRYSLLQSYLEQAKERIIICSPTMADYKNYIFDINDLFLKTPIVRGIAIYFVCSSEPYTLTHFSTVINKLHSAKIKLIALKNIHLKTIIIDDDIFAEGPLIVTGSAVKQLISNFFNSRIGEAVLNNMYKEESAQTIVKRDIASDFYITNHRK